MASTNNEDQMSDPSEWTSLPSALAALERVDNALRCDICKDFFTNPVITNCNHTFCSLCIRRCLAAEGRCPSCRTTEQESRLRRNGAITESVDAFKNARVGLLDLGRGWEQKEQESTTEQEQTTSRRGKRKRQDVVETAGTDPPGYRTRSRRKVSRANGSEPNEPMIISDNERDADFTPTSSASQPQEEPQRQPWPPSDGLVACPICSQRMKEHTVSGHLDNACPGFQVAQAPDEFRQLRSGPLKPPPPSKPPERLPQLNLSLLNDQKLRKKLSDLGIPAHGSRQLQQRRHAEWLALWNANCDAKEPKSRRQLLQDLDAWERSQGTGSTNGGDGIRSGIMGKNFDADIWVKKNKGEFDDLIKKAREGRAKKNAELSKASDVDHNADQAMDGSQDSDRPAINGHFGDTVSTALSPPPPVERPVTAPPSTEAIPTAAFEDSQPAHEGIIPPPQLSKTILVPESASHDSHSGNARNTLHGRNNEPPSPASLMFTHSNSLPENSDQGASLSINTNMNASKIPQIDVSPVRRYHNNPNNNDQIADELACTSRRCSVVNGQPVQGFGRKDGGSGDPGPPRKMPMFTIPGRGAVDGDGTGMR